jgi:hypothetical protein
MDPEIHMSRNVKFKKSIDGKVRETQMARFKKLSLKVLRNPDGKI